MALHIVSKSPDQDNALGACLRLAADDDSLLLIEDGVYAAVRNLSGYRRLAGRAGPCYALEDDVIARGLSDRIGAEIQLVDYAGFVELCEAHAHIQSWF